MGTYETVGLLAIGALSACAVGELPEALLDHLSSDRAAFVDRPAYPSYAETPWSEETQGVAHDATSWYLSDRWTIFKVPMTADLAAGAFQAAAPLPPDCGHFGDLDHARGHIFVPVENCSGRSPNRIYVLDAATLRVERWASIPTVAQTQASWIAVTPDGRLVSSQSEADALNFYAPDFRDGSNLRLLTRVPLPRMFRGVQGGEVSAEGILYLVSGDDVHPELAGIYLFDVSGARAEQVGFIPDPEVGEDGAELEGLTLWDLDAARTRAPGVAGEVHWLRLYNNVFSGDQVSMAHVSTRGL